MAARYTKCRDEDLAQEESYHFGRWAALLELRNQGVQHRALDELLAGTQIAAGVLLCEMQRRGIKPRAIHDASLQ